MCSIPPSPEKERDLQLRELEKKKKKKAALDVSWLLKNTIWGDDL